MKIGIMVVGFSGDRFLLEWCLESLVVVDGKHGSWLQVSFMG